MPAFKKIFGPSSTVSLALAAKVLTLCPICLGAAGGWSATVGVAVGWFSPWRAPIMLAFLMGALFPIVLQAKRHGRWWPPAVGLVAAAAVVLGSFVWVSPVLLWAGVALLAGVSLWQAVIQKTSQGCSSCDVSNQPNKRRKEKMAVQRKVEVFSANCPVCKETVAMVKDMACPDCEVSVLDMSDEAVATRAKSLGIRSLPAVVVNGHLASCCDGQGVNPEELRKMCGTR